MPTILTITYATKRSGDTFAPYEVNEIKDVVNNHADRLGEIASGVAGQQTQIEGLAAGAGVVERDATQTTAAVAANVLNRWTEPVTDLVLTFAAGATGHVSEYMLEFTVSGTTFTLTLPSGVRWQDEPEWEAGWTYQVSVMGGLAIAAGWEAAEA